MRYKKGFIINDLLIYLFIGAILISLSLNIFTITIKSFWKNKKNLNEFNDFYITRMILKKDIITSTKVIECSEKHILFEKYITDGQYLRVNKYKLQLINNNLMYLITNESGIENREIISDKVKDIRFIKNNQVIRIELLYERERFNISLPCLG